MRCRKRIKNRTEDGTQSCPSAGPITTMTRCAVGDLAGKIEVGQFYEIDRSKLPARTPRLLLLSVRVVKVTEKTELNVTVKYPSAKSLETFFDDEQAKGANSAKVPTMDEKFIMAPQLAHDVLARRVPSREFSLNCDCKSFWLAHAIKDETFSLPVSACNSSDDDISKKGICLSKLRCSGLIGWGMRRLIAYGDHPCSTSSPSEDGGEPKKEEEDEKNAIVTRSMKQARQPNDQGKMANAIHNQVSQKLKKKEKNPQAIVAHGNRQCSTTSSEDGTEPKDEEGDETNTKDTRSMKRVHQSGDQGKMVNLTYNQMSRKLKKKDKNLQAIVPFGVPQCSNSSPSKDGGESKIEEQDEKNTAITRSMKRACQSNTGKMVNSIHKCNQLSRKLKKKDKNRQVDKSRWTAERYDRATKELLEVLKVRGAFPGKAISRCVLRQEARKRIGDTGLLDHLLKHMAGKVAPDGIHRFRRRFDPEGFMEYWLERAELADIRKEAGILDPFWIPPPGWSPGDPICIHGSECTAEIKQLREELTKMKREMQELESVNEGDLMALDIYPDCLDSVEPFELPDIDHLNPSQLKEKYEEMLKRKSEVEKQLSSISEALRDMEVLLRTQEQQA